MSQIHGMSGAESNLLKEYSPRIQSFEDIDTILAGLQNDLENEKNIFFENLPMRIDSEKNTLENLRHEEKEVEDFWNHEIDKIQREINDNRFKFWKYINLIIKTKISKPKAMDVARSNIASQNFVIETLENTPENIFKKEKDGKLFRHSEASPTDVINYRVLYFSFNLYMNLLTVAVRMLFTTIVFSKLYQFSFLNSLYHKVLQCTQ